MKRSAFILLFLFYFLDSLHASWRRLTKEELLLHADAIVVADFQGYKSLLKPQDRYDQLGRFQNVETLEGYLPTSFEVYGSSEPICAPQIDFRYIKSGRYLLFLTKKTFGLVDCNAFISPILDEKINWFVKGDSTKTSSQKLSEVLLELKNILKPNPILITGYDQFDLLAKEAAFKKAAELARADFSKGTYHLLAYGLRSTAFTPSEKFLRIKYQIYTVPIASCIVSEGILSAADGYNSTMKPLLIKKFGKDIFAEAETY